MSRMSRFTAVLALFLVTNPIHAIATASYAGTTVLQGKSGGAAYMVEMPDRWNKTLVVWSHGYNAPGGLNDPPITVDPAATAWFLDHGYALAGWSFSSTGWAISNAFHDQIALLDFFTRRFGRPKRAIAWGDSMGGMITAGLVERFPARFAAALPMCGMLGGGSGQLQRRPGCRVCLQNTACPPFAPATRAY